MNRILLSTVAIASALFMLNSTPVSAYTDTAYDEMCYRYAKIEDWHNAFFYCRESAYAGDKKSRMHYVRALLQQTEGLTTQVLEEGLRLSLKSAREGNMEGYILAGQIRQIGTYPDYKEALGYFKKAYEAKNDDAIVHIAKLYYGADKLNNANLAKEWFEKGAAKNIADAQYGLGLVLYESGDPREAARSFNLAAKNGNPQAMIAMARLFSNGVVYKADKIRAIRWLKLAIRAGREDVRPELTRLLSDMQDEERLRLLQERDRNHPEYNRLNTVKG